MSVIDRFQEELVARLRELRPLAVEYHQLEQVARRLGLALDDEPTTPPRKRRSSRKTRPTQPIPATAVESAPPGNASAATAQTSATSTPQRPRRPSWSSTDKRQAGRQRQSRRQQDLLRLIHDRPGITVKEIATELDVDATNLYRHVRKLQQDGLITKHGTALQPTSRSTPSRERAADNGPTPGAGRAPRHPRNDTSSTPSATAPPGGQQREANRGRVYSPLPSGESGSGPSRTCAGAHRR